MNRRLMKILLTVILLVPLGILHGETALAGDGTAEAEATVESYLNSLVNGDIPGIKSTLSPGLLHDKAPVLDSPSYEVMLRSLYPKAKYRILNASPSGTNRVKVDSVLTLYSGHLMNASFLVLLGADGRYLIDEELQ